MDEERANVEWLAEMAELPERNPGPVMKMTNDGVILLANAAARAFLGSDDVRGLCWPKLCPGMTDELWQRVLAIEPGSDTRLIHEAENERDLCIQFSHLRSESGDLVFAYGADITQRKRDEQLLRETTEHLREYSRFPEMNPSIVVRLDIEATILMANPMARDVLGEGLIGLCWFDLCPGIDDALWRRILTPGSDEHHEAAINDRYYDFTHRFDVDTQLVFVYGVDLTAQKTAERALRQSEKMATLGTLVAGVAHELNNPAAATRRAAEQLSEAFDAFDAAHQSLGTIADAPDALAAIRELDQWARAGAVRPGGMNTVQRSDREAELEGWLEDHGIDEPWEFASTLVAQGIETAHLERVAGDFDPDTLTSVLSWATSAFRVHALAHEIGQGAGRISEIVSALKSYSYLGQAPVQAVDVHEGLDNTLVILRNKLKQGIEVVREYGEVPSVAAYGSELNQAWTNLLDNAADAMGGEGRIVIRTRRDGDHAVVEVVDDGPGIPEEIQHKIFDPFFTTKDPGKGTGLGLSTTYSIITEKHRGTITLDSRPGETRFVVRLPLESAGGA
jgi:signal transduction histidine kinase